MNTDLTKQLQSLSLGSFPMPMPMPIPGAPRCRCSPLALLRVAVLVKYGGTIEEAAFKFEEALDEIYKRHGAEESDPALTDKLNALKAEVGDVMFEKLLANPEVERMAGRAYRKAVDARIDAAIDELDDLFNGAISQEDLLVALAALTEAEDPIRLLAES